MHSNEDAAAGMDCASSSSAVRANSVGDQQRTLTNLADSSLEKPHSDRPTKPCFIEAQIASLQAANGFRVEIVGESGLRGRDFDLVASRDGIVLNIEVTGKDDIPLSAKTVRNTLTSKRTQLPVTGPAIVYMHVPATWMQDLKSAQATFSEAFIEVFCPVQTI